MRNQKNYSLELYVLYVAFSLSSCPCAEVKNKQTKNSKKPTHLTNGAMSSRCHLACCRKSSSNLKKKTRFGLINMKQWTYLHRQLCKDTNIEWNKKNMGGERGGGEFQPSPPPLLLWAGDLSWIGFLVAKKQTRSGSKKKKKKRASFNPCSLLILCLHCSHFLPQVLLVLKIAFPFKRLSESSIERPDLNYAEATSIRFSFALPGTKSVVHLRSRPEG